jgi:hypothetical protein
LGNLQMVGTASNVGSRTTYFNKIVFDVKTPKVQTCDFTFVNGSTVSLPGGGTTSTGLSPGQMGTFLNFTDVPFGPLEVRNYTEWDETAPAGAGQALATRMRTDAGMEAMMAAIEADRAMLRRLAGNRETASRESLHRLRHQVEARLRELERRMAPANAAGRVRMADSLVLPLRLQRGPTGRDPAKR